MSSSVAHSPQRYYVNNTTFDIPPQSSGRSSVYNKSRKNGSTNGVNMYVPVPDYDNNYISDNGGKKKRLQREVSDREQEINDLQLAKLSLEKEKQIQDMQIAQLQSDKEFFMKSAIQTNHKLQDLKNTQLNTAIEENDQLKSRLNEINDRERNLDILVKNQRQQISELEKQLMEKGQPQINGVLASNSPDNYASPSDYNPASPNHGRNVNKEMSSPFLNSNQNRYFPQFQPEKQKQYYSSSGFQNKRDLSLNRDTSKRNYTPLTKKKQPKPMTDDYLSSLNSGSRHNLMPESYRSSRPQLSVTEPSDTIPDDPERCTPDELLHAVQILQKLNINMERRYKQENDALKYKLERGTMLDADLLAQLQMKDGRILELENQLRDKEKELSMAYLKMQTTQPPRRMNLNNGNLSALSRDPSPQVNNSMFVQAPPPQSESMLFQSMNNPVSSITKQQVSTPKRMKIIGGQEDENLRIASHGRMVRMTVWTNNQRVFGFSMQYLKDDGTLVEPNNNYFYSKNLRYDYFVVDEGDTIQEIVGRFNIKGVRALTVVTSRGMQKTFKPTGEIRTFEIERPELDDLFKYTFRKNENVLKAIFPNVFYYDMKGARVPDRQDQNFLYIQYNKIISLQNPEMMMNPKKKSEPSPPPPPPPPVEKKVPVIIKPTPVPTPQQPPSPPPSSKPATVDDADNRPISHHFSDSYDSYKLREGHENDVKKINFSDGDLIFYQKKLKIYKMKVWFDDNYIYGIKVSYLTPDGFNLIQGKQHIGIENLFSKSKEIIFEDSDSHLSKVIYYQKGNAIQKLICQQLNGTRNSFGKNVPTQGSKEISIDLTINSYLYGTLSLFPESISPGNLVLCSLKSSQIPQK